MLIGISSQLSLSQRLPSTQRSLTLLLTLSEETTTRSQDVRETSRHIQDQQGPGEVQTEGRSPSPNPSPLPTQLLYQYSQVLPQKPLYLINE